MVLTKQERSTLRANLFRHLDGIVTAPTAYTLYEAGVLDYLLENPSSPLKDIAEKFDLVPQQHNENNKWYKVVIMDHVEIDNLLQLIDALKKRMKLS